jgi:hypothetical protein
MSALPEISPGGAVQRPLWASLIEPCPDYDNSRTVIVDTQTFFDVLGRGPKRNEMPGLDRWNNELSWLFNSPANEIRIKMNSQVYREVLASGTSPLVAQQRAFVDAYRQSGKIIFDHGEVPFFATGRMTLYHQVHDALAASGNLGKGDLPIAADGITNRLRIISHDVRFIDGLDKALRGRMLKSILKTASLPDDIGKIFISPKRSAL